MILIAYAIETKTARFHAALLHRFWKSEVISRFAQKREHFYRGKVCIASRQPLQGAFMPANRYNPRTSFTRMRPQAEVVAIVRTFRSLASPRCTISLFLRKEYIGNR